jgi:hypothetical protein
LNKNNKTGNTAVPGPGPETYYKAIGYQQPNTGDIKINETITHRYTHTSTAN